jgi:hypothetical protein
MVNGLQCSTEEKGTAGFAVQFQTGQESIVAGYYDAGKLLIM